MRGHAQGNVFNHADGPDQIYVAPRKGKVYVYQSPRVPDSTNSDTSITCEVMPQIKPVLKALSRRFSPVSSKSYMYNKILYLFYTLLEYNQRVFVFEEGNWSAKGRYETALEDNDNIMWTFDGIDKLHLLIVSNYAFLVLSFDIYKLD